MSKLVLIDFKDSFTYNIYHYLIGMGVEVDVLDDGNFEVNQLDKYDGIIFSPGPGLPTEKKSLFPVLEQYGSTKKILGICLGMQGVVEYFGGEIYNQKLVQHGIQKGIRINDNSSIFKDVPANIKVGLYHSWACDITKSQHLKCLAISEDGVLMAVKHQTLLVYGVQFHPESILTEFGKEILLNFVNFKD